MRTRQDCRLGMMCVLVRLQHVTLTMLSAEAVGVQKPTTCPSTRSPMRCAAARIPILELGGKRTQGATCGPNLRWMGVIAIMGLHTRLQRLSVRPLVGGFAPKMRSRMVAPRVPAAVTMPICSGHQPVAVSVSHIPLPLLLLPKTPPHCVPQRCALVHACMCLFRG